MKKVTKDSVVRKRSTRSTSRTRATERKESAEKRTKSPGRPRSPSRRTSRKPVEVEKKKSPTPVLLVENIKNTIARGRESLSPGKIEEVIRASVTRFEEVTADFVSSVRRSNRLSKEQQLSVDESSEDKKPTLLENNNHDEKPLQKQTSCAELIFPLIGIIVIPAIIVGAHLVCTKDSCPLIPEKIEFSWRTFFDVEPMLWYGGFLILQFILASLPLGFKVKSTDRQDNFSYRLNGLPILVIMTAALFGLQHYARFPLVKVLDKPMPMLITATAMGVLLGVLLLLKNIGKEPRRPYGYTGNFLLNLYTGNELYPRFGPLDIKTTVFKSLVISTIVYDILFIYKEIHGKTLEQISINVVLVCALQLAYWTDFLLFEPNFYGSFSVNHDGVGVVAILISFMYPFLNILLPNYLYLSRVPCNIYLAVGAVALCLTGLIITRVSLWQKTRCKNDITSLPISDVIHSRSSALYRGGLWGIVRHPNYLGAIMAYLSFSLLAVYPYHWIPLLLFAYTLTEFLFQIHRVEDCCHTKHGSAWNIYRSQVKYKLLPKIY